MESLVFWSLSTSLIVFPYHTWYRPVGLRPDTSGQEAWQDLHMLWILVFIFLFDFFWISKPFSGLPGIISIHMTIYLYQLFCCSSEFRFNSFSRWRKIGSNVPCLHECHRMLGPAAWKVGHSRSMEKEISKSYKCINTLWLFKIAMENDPLIDHLCLFTAPF